MIRKAIILAAGRGSRMNGLTKDRPKCLIEIGGKTILRHQLDALHNGGIEKVVVVRGYLKEALNESGIVYYDNPDYGRSNMLRSLFCAETEMDEGFIFSFADIIYEPQALHSLIKCPDDFAIVVDTDWKDNYIGRMDHPVSEANLVKVSKGRVVRIGKKIIDPDTAHGEFIGLGKFSKKGAGILKNRYNLLRAHYQNAEDQRFYTSDSFQMGYMDDIFQDLIKHGYPIASIDIRGGWWEMDTVEDVERVRNAFAGTNQS